MKNADPGRWLGARKGTAPNPVHRVAGVHRGAVPRNRDRRRGTHPWRDCRREGSPSPFAAALRGAGFSSVEPAPRPPTSRSELMKTRELIRELKAAGLTRRLAHRLAKHVESVEVDGKRIVVIPRPQRLHARREHRPTPIVPENDGFTEMRRRLGYGESQLKRRTTDESF
jgi:hypothetical protein